MKKSDFADRLLNGLLDVWVSALCLFAFVAGMAVLVFTLILIFRFGAFLLGGI